MQGSRRDLLVTHVLGTPRCFGSLLFPLVHLGQTAVVVVSQTSEVVEDGHFQVWPGQSIRQLLADGFEDADSRLFLDTPRKCLLLVLGLLLRRRLMAGHAIAGERHRR